ncbi:hypothetical protein J1P26_21795 [Neobacillus sp. MM2021_6]|uniref:hypothetical protein n=1 Tax=Bacillaceae TaxID=186817 RepID=UPI00140D1838|nr:MULTISPECIES: hypothetical protein [Bacillaceae]MBO0962340.1 hypothetical protein [Neobacillus sp. MM2021_6]NHC20823.1 hypothetical protein [Bacillus sp. MM2020_4]
MPDLFKTNSQNIVGGPGRLVWSPFGTTVPAAIADVMDLATYELKAPWKDLGATNEGISTSRSFETEDFEVDQVKGPVDSDITSWEHSIETQLAENTLENRQLALIGGPIIETAPTLGTATTTTGALVVGATIIAVTSATGFLAGKYLKIGNEVLKIGSISGNSIYLAEPVKTAAASGASVSPVTALGTKRIGYGTTSNLPMIMIGLISQKKDGSLYMAIYRKCQISGDEKTQGYSKEKRLLPLKLKAFPVDGVDEIENVYYEIEETR